MNKLYLIVAMTLIAAGCGSSSSGTGGQGGTGGVGGGGGGAGGDGGTGGAEPKCQTPEEMLRCDKVVNIAHRGGRRIRPEHTIMAYDKALEDGADILELDVHETSDGVLVVMHDATVDRTTDCTGAIKEMTFEELRQCDAGYALRDEGGDYPYAGMGLVVPTMEEVLDRYAGTPFVIEIKQQTPSIVDHFVEVIRDYEMTDEIIGSAFSDTVLGQLRAAAPEIATNMGENETLVFWGKAYDPIDPEYDPPAEFLQVPTTYNVGDRIVDVLHPGFIPRAHELDMYVQVWTINDEQDMRDLIAMGVDGIMTDDPPLLTQVIEELGAGD